MLTPCQQVAVAAPRILLVGTPFSPPQRTEDGYNCPHCGAFAEQRQAALLFQYADGSGRHEQRTWLARTCTRCREHSVWNGEVLVYPDSNPAPPPNADLSDDIRRDYDEAAAIVSRSPRGAAALLRLAIQKIAIELGGKGKSIDDDIAALVQKGLSERIQQAMDVLRVIGNNAVHPGQIDLKDDTDTALRLFELLNVVADAMISEPRRIEEMYGKLPATAREAIEQRDTPKE